VMVPCCSPGRQQQQQQQSQLPPASGLDMPGNWRVMVSQAGKVTSNIRSSVRLVSSPLARQLQQLAADHFLLRAHHIQVGLDP
jgi:hypothetical protein